MGLYAYLPINNINMKTEKNIISKVNESTNKNYEYTSYPFQTSRNNLPHLDGICDLLEYFSHLDLSVENEVNIAELSYLHGKLLECLHNVENFIILKNSPESSLKF